MSCLSGIISEMLLNIHSMERGDDSFSNNLILLYVSNIVA